MGARLAHLRCPPADDLFWAKVDKQPGGCWLWTGCTRNAYGRVGRRVSGKTRYYSAHRVAYESIKGPVPDGMQLDHLCRTLACVNPDHLEPVTQVENVQRGLRGNITHCPQGHRYQDGNVYVIPSTGGRMCRICKAAGRRAEKVRSRERRKLGIAGKPGNPGIPLGPISHRARPRVAASTKEVS